MIITPEKRISLIKLALATVAVLFGFYFLLIRPVNARVAKKKSAAEELTNKINAKSDIIKRAGRIKEQLTDSGRQLKRIEDQMVTGDSYLWIIKTLSDFETPDRIEFTKYDPPRIIEPIAAKNVPYKTASYVVIGTSAFHDFGRFLARFENIYPHIRVNRVDLEPAGVGIDSDEKLSFLIELHVLVKPGTATGSNPGS